MPIIEQELLAKIDAFLQSRNMAPTRFGKLTMGDPSLVEDLRLGRELRFVSREKIKNFMREYRREAAE